MTRPFARAIATAFLALGSMSVYAADEAASQELLPAAADVRLPDFTAAAEDFYPASAARKLQQGSAGVEFRIDAQGHVEILAQPYADDPDFAASAAEFLKRGRFRVTDDWVQSGGTQLRFAVEIQFSLTRGGIQCAPKPPRVADTQVITVCRAQPSRRSGRL